ncbi:acyltransferase-domain-containing protein [Anaeromyces robustus]|uniref:Acyltransferase-domain-containing protein n=1 Tax=Anaeromyces robustus TaxID=1754192 RepID=A0A1Y1XEE8_9FUNG|nr:acyltransferase-domain-containing protein [Anaeromyces robustus]|eukprot:ORX84119.1 acyltransferase-domain-containing protein [Anaeromyces robustus]
MFENTSRLGRLAFYGGGIFSFCVALNAIQLVTSPLFKINKEKARNLNASLAGSVWLLIQDVFEKKHKGKITYSGDDLPEKENAIVIVNHRSWDDFILVNSVAFRKRTVKSLKYFAKDSLKFLPGFGWGMYLMGQIFVKRNWTSDKKKIDKAFNGIKKDKEPVWIITYLEGTRFTREKLIQSHAFAKERNLPIFNNVLIPRVKGFNASVNAFRNSHVKYVYDFTLAYNHKEKGFGELPSIATILSSDISNYQFHIHIRRIPIESIPENEEEVYQWAIKMFHDKDKLLEDLKQNWTKNIDVISEEKMEWKGLLFELKKLFSRNKDVKYLE